MSTLYRYAKHEASCHTILSLDRERFDSIGFSLLNFSKGEEFALKTKDLESALLLIEGEAEVEFRGEKTVLQRQNWKDQAPSIFHLSCEEDLHLKTARKSRFALIQTVNTQNFASKFYSPEEISVEHRGQGILDDTCYRHVRLAFDKSNAPEEAQLVLGEVLTFPGRWSSYPPHHHEQDEIYYYEFSAPEAFGFGQCGEEVYKIHNSDLLYISGGKDHSQVSIPGYHMYYIWAIRHGTKPYTGFEFTEPFEKLLT